MKRLAGPELAGLRLDVALASLAEVSRARAQALIREGCALINGRPAPKTGVLLAPGDEIFWEIPPAQPVRAVAQDIPIDVLYEDEDLLVVNKPRGMVVHPAPGHGDGTLVNALLGHCDDLSGVGGELRPGIVHRLDKDTTGLMVAAKRDGAHQAFSDMLKTHDVRREYAAVALGRFKDERFSVDQPIGRSPRDRKKMAVDASGRSAVTDFTLLETGRGATLLSCSLHTGRTHQIRVHLNFLGHPILGDPIYGGSAAQKSPVLMLHAYRLRFLHPVSGQEMAFFAPPPQDSLAELQKWDLVWRIEP